MTVKDTEEWGIGDRTPALSKSPALRNMVSKECSKFQICTRTSWYVLI